MPPSSVHSRRSLLIGAGAILACGATVAAANSFSALEASVGGRLGVCAIDTGGGARLVHRTDDRFAMCSTFKLLAVAAVLARVDRGQEDLHRLIPYGESDLIDYAPVTKPHVGQGGMALQDLCEAAIELSDNTAANLILARIGGPAGYTAFARSLGDSVTRLDRIEPALNSARPGDPRDTTSPAAMAANLRSLVLGSALKPASRDRLIGWMTACKTGDHRLRAGFPAGWRVGDKTGTGDQGTANDIAVAWTPGAPIIIASYLTGAPSATPAARDAVHAKVAGVVAQHFRPHG